MIQTECGLVSIISNTYIDSNNIITKLKKLQHRGRESFGISWFNNSFHVRKYDGLITHTHLDPYSDSSNNIILSKYWLGHVRYSTSAKIQLSEYTQPILSNTFNYSLAHNVNIPTYVWPSIYKKYLFDISNSDVTDTIILSNFIDFLLNKNYSWKDIIKIIIEDIPGVYSIVIITSQYTYILRDRFGIRPLTYLFYNNVYFIVSETTSINNLDPSNNFIDVLPGQSLLIDNDSLSISLFYSSQNSNYSFCIFEFIYFMRDDSTVNSLSVKQFKSYIGKTLAQQFINSNNIDFKNALVCGVPQSGILYGTSFAQELSLQYLQFIQRKADYPWRTFILKTNAERILACKQKYFIDNDITDKTVIVVDDSIVRGNTLKHLISLIKSYSPKSIHFVVASPPIKYTCHYGVDFADIEELVANNMSISQMVSYFGFDSLTYLDLDKINNIQFGTNSNFCNACFTGKYLF